MRTIMWVFMITLSAFAVLGTNGFSINRDKESNANLWLESASSFRGWSLDVRHCKVNQEHNSTEYQQLPSLNSCEGQTPIVSKGWSLPSGYTANLHSPIPGEGIVLSVFNQRNAKLILQKVFPLGKYWFHWADFVWYIEHIAPGRLVSITVSVAGCLGLRQGAQLLSNLGSMFAQYLTVEAHWSWLFVKGGRTISEAAVIPGSAGIHLHSPLPLCFLPDPQFTTVNPLEKSRWQYCAQEGGMGKLCDEDSPTPLPFPSPLTLSATVTSALAEVPVILTAGNRHQYLQHTLTTLLHTPGAQPHNLFVVLGDAPPSTTKLLHLLNVTYTTLSVQGRDNNKLFDYYRNVYKYIAHTFPDAPAVIILDEDIQVSPDFFSFMSQTLWLLEKDPSIYCINAFSATGFRELAHNPSRVFRGTVQVEWGYAVSLNFVREALAIWPTEAEGIPIIIYDYWLYSYVSKERECIFPEIARTLHFGAGINTDSNPITTERAFLNKTVVQTSGVPLANIERLLQSPWHYDLQHNITHATPLVGNPCNKNFIPKVSKSSRPHENSNTDDYQLYAFYYHLDSIEEEGRLKPDVVQFFHLYNCFGAWSLSEQGQHKGVGILPLASDTILYLIGVPYSTFSYLKPEWVPLWDINTIPEEQFEIVDDNKMGRHKFTVNVPNLNMTSLKLMNILSGV